MIKHFNVASCILLIFTLFPGSATATIGMPGPGFYLSVYFFLAPVAGFLLAIAFIIKKNNDKNKSLAHILTSIAGIYTCLLGIIYFFSITEHWFSGSEALTTSTLFAVFVISLLYYFIEDRRRKYWIIPGTTMLFLVVSFFTPGIVNFRYYTFLDNKPLNNPNETIVKMGGAGHALRHLKLSDGRILSFDKNMYSVSLPRQALVKKVGTDKFHVSYKGKTSHFKPREQLLYRRDKNAFFHIPLQEIKINNYRVYELGTGRLVGEQEEKDINLYYSAKVNPSRTGACQTAKVASLLISGANPNYNPQPASETYRLPTATGLAVFHDCTDIVDLLIKSGANIHIVDNDSNTLLHKAVTDHSWNYISGADLSTKAIYIVKLLIDAGVDIDAVNKKGDSALHIAARYRRDITQLLIRSDANISTINKNGETPLESAKKYFQHYGDKAEGKLIIELLEQTGKEALETQENVGISYRSSLRVDFPLSTQLNSVWVSIQP